MRLLRLNADLQRAGLVTSDRSGDTFKFQPGSVTRLEISRPSEDTDKLAITVGVGVPCGNDDVVYVYDYSQGPPQRVLESHGTRDHDESLSDVRFSKRDAMSSQLILTLRYGVQCGSSWNVLSYDLFRLSTTTNMAAPILGGEHGIWFGADNHYQLRLEPDELLMGTARPKHRWRNSQPQQQRVLVDSLLEYFPPEKQCEATRSNAKLRETQASSPRDKPVF